MRGDEGAGLVRPLCCLLGPIMTISERLLAKRQRHLKWPAFDVLEIILMMICGLLLFGFCTTVIFDIVTRTIGRPWLWLQEVTSAFFIYAIFVGTAVASRRNDHLYLTAIADALHGTPRLVIELATRLVVLGVALCMIYFGWINFLRGFSSFRMPSMTPIATLYIAIPVSGVLVALFTIEQLVNGWRNGFEHEEPPEEPLHVTPIDAVTPGPRS
jgi:TRAP-type C4-dicarboxylate transport system permease small subunit